MNIVCQPTDKSYGVSSGFGFRWGSLHDGADIPTPTGTPLYAMHDGVVRNLTDPGGYGLYVQVDGADGYSQYGHMSRTGVVPNGTHVKAGTLLGWSGNTGSSTGPHVHIRIRPRGAGPTDPTPLLQGKPFAPAGGGAVTGGASAETSQVPVMVPGFI